jgi:protein pmbA homolog
MNNNEFFELCINRGFSNIEITIYDNKEYVSEVENEKINFIDIKNNIFYKVKARKENKTVILDSNYLNEDLIDLLEEKIEYIDSNVEDKFLDLLDNNNIIQIKENKDFSKYVDKIINLTKLEEDIFNLTATLSYNISKIQIINDKGVNIENVNSYYDFAIISYGRKEDKVVNAYRTVMQKDFNLNELVILRKEVIEEVKNKFNKNKINSKKYKCLFKQEVIEELLSEIIEAISLKSVNLNLSLFKDRIGEKIFSEKISLVEDPCGESNITRYLFDEEGNKTYKKSIIENGILKLFISNNKESSKNNMISTSNAFDEIGVRNLMLLPGEKSEKEIIKNIKEGLIITDIAGAGGQAIDIVSGSISLLVNGFYIVNGKIDYYFEQAIMTSTIKEIFNNVLEISNTVQYSNEIVRSPSLLIDDIIINS